MSKVFTVGRSLLVGLVWEVQEAIFSLFFFLNEKSDIEGRVFRNNTVVILMTTKSHEVLSK